MKRFLLACFLYLPFFLFSISDAVDNTTLYNRALGGPHAGMVRGFDTFFNNPALLAFYEPEVLFFKMDTNFKGHTIGLANLYLGGELSLDDQAAAVNTLKANGYDRLLVGFNMSGPIGFGFVGNNWGWAVLNTTGLNIDLPYLLGEAEVVFREDLVLAAGVAFPMPFFIGESFKMEFTPGVMSRITLRNEVVIERDLLGVLGLMNNASAILEDNPIYFSPMFAIDLGFNLNVNDIVSIAGVIKDIYTPILKYPVENVGDALSVFTTSSDTSGRVVYREVNIGVAYTVPLGPLDGVISNIDVYLDYYDLLMFEKNVWLHWGIGTDITLLEKLHILTGFNEGLLSLGLDVDLDGFDVGFAMYGTEEAMQPGQRPVFNFLFSIGVSF